MYGSPARSQQDSSYCEAARRFAGAIDRLARGYEADPELRRDLLQDIHAQLWRSFAYFEGQCSERSWVYRVAHNVAVSHMITRRRISGEKLSALEELPDIPGEEDVEANAAESDIAARLLATIHRLRPTDRQVMLLYLEDLTAAEIGEVTGLSPGAVATRIHRLKAVLADKFKLEDPE